MFFSALLITFLAAVAIQGHPTGAPAEVCDSMMPGHGVQPQQSELPYDIIIEKPNLKGGESTTVTIKGKNDETFKGFLIQARFDKKPVGKFTIAENVGKLLNCGYGTENAVTHSDASDKKQVTLTWIAPKNLEGQVTFYVTIVKEYTTFWVAHKSEPVTIS